MFLGEVDVKLTQKWKRTEERVKKKETQKYREKTSMQKIAASEDDMFQDISCDTDENLAEIGSEEDVKSDPTFCPQNQ